MQVSVALSYLSRTRWEHVHVFVRPRSVWNLIERYSPQLGTFLKNIRTNQTFKVDVEKTVFWFLIVCSKWCFNNVELSIVHPDQSIHNPRMNCFVQLQVQQIWLLIMKCCVFSCLKLMFALCCSSAASFKLNITDIGLMSCPEQDMHFKRQSYGLHFSSASSSSRSDLHDHVFLLVVELNEVSAHKLKLLCVVTICC